MFPFSLFTLNSFQNNNPLNPLLVSFDSFSLSFADKMTIETHSSVYFKVTIILLELTALLSAHTGNKTQLIVPLSFDSIFQLINGI